MQQIFDITETSRKVLLQFLEKYSVEELNKIPEGFSNNIIWNIGHIIVVQQMLVYKLSSLPMMISEEMIEKFKKGTKPEHEVNQQEIDEIKAMLFETIDKTKIDFNENRFKTYYFVTCLAQHI